MNLRSKLGDRIPRIAAPSPVDIAQEMQYHRNINNLKFELSKRPDDGPQSQVAVVLHLYYTDMWEEFAAELRRIKKSVHFDLFVTLPIKNEEYAKNIQHDFPGAFILGVPNRGRDVLPFLKLSAVLLNSGYNYLLKLHSKKSTHRTDGGEWLGELVENLLPSNKASLEQLFKILEQPETGIVGPAGQYMQLTVNFDANGRHMTRILNDINRDKTKTYSVLQSQRGQYGFFAGTMFWTRLDALEPIIDRHYGVLRFEREAGQIDGTFAHALERMFCVVPEVEGRDMYEIGPDGVNKIAYDSGTVPDWSGVYIGPKN